MKKILAFLLLPAAAFAQPAATGGPVDITANQLDVFQTQGKAVFAGAVKVIQGNLTLTAPRLTVLYGKAGQGDIQEMRAEGGATITRSGSVPEKAVGDIAIYNPSKQQLTMEDNVELTRGPSTLAGDRLLYDIASGNAKVTSKSGPVKARFTPQ